jgi:hypothetical protein
MTTALWIIYGLGAMLTFGFQLWLWRENAPSDLRSFMIVFVIVMLWVIIWPIAWGIAMLGIIIDWFTAPSWDD